MARLIGQVGNCSGDRVAQTKGQDQPRVSGEMRPWPAFKRMAPVGGPSLISPLLVVPMTVTFDDYRSVAIVIVPAAMQPAIMYVEPNARAAIVVVTIAIVIISVAADAEAETLRARDGRRRNRDGR